MRWRLWVRGPCTDGIELDGEIVKEEVGCLIGMNGGRRGRAGVPFRARPGSAGGRTIGGRGASCWCLWAGLKAGFFVRRRLAMMSWRVVLGIYLDW